MGLILILKSTLSPTQEDQRGVAHTFNLPISRYCGCYLCTKMRGQRKSSIAARWELRHRRRGLSIVDHFFVSGFARDETLLQKQWLPPILTIQKFAQRP